MSKNPQDLGHEQRMSTEMRERILLTAASLTCHLNCHLRLVSFSPIRLSPVRTKKDLISLGFPAQNAVSEAQEVLRKDLLAT